MAARSQTWRKMSSRNQLQLLPVDNIIKVKAAANTTAHASYLERTEGAQRACQMTGLQIPERSSAAVKKYPQSPIIIIVIAIIIIIILLIPVPLYRLFCKN